MKYPDPVARFYDVIYHQLRTIDEKYYMRKIKEAGGGSILEIGTGTGRFFIEALQAGADIYGVDSSESMLNILKSKLDPKFQNRIIQQDATQLDLNKKFKLVIAPFRMFSHLIETEEQIEMLNHVHDHLEEDGIFIFDLFVPNLSLIQNGISKRVDFEGEYETGKKLKRVVSVVPDFMNQVNHVTMEYIWDEGSGEKSESWEFPMRYFFRYELKHLLARSKLHLQNIFGDYEEHPLSNDSKDFIVVCRK